MAHFPIYPAEKIKAILHARPFNHKNGKITAAISLLETFEHDVTITLEDMLICLDHGGTIAEFGARCLYVRTGRDRLGWTAGGPSGKPFVVKREDWEAYLCEHPLPEPENPTLHQTSPHAGEAVEMKLGLEAGVLDLAAVIKWADNILLWEDYDDDIANISMASQASTKEMITLLNRVALQSLEWNAMRKTMARMHQTLLDSPPQARSYVRLLDRFCIRHHYNIPRDMHFMTSLDDDFQLAEAGDHGTVEEVTQSLLEHLAKYTEWK